MGDLITVLTFKEPTDPAIAGNKDNTKPESQSATSVITKLLVEVGISSFSGKLPNTLYNYPLNLSGSYLQSVGKLLYAHNQVAWIDNQERFRITNVNIKTTQSLVNLIVGKNELWYRRLGGAEAPCEKVKVVGTQIVTREIELNNETTTEQYGSPVVLDPESTGLIIIKEIKVTQVWDEDHGTFTITTQTIEPWGFIVARAFWYKFADVDADPPQYPPDLFKSFVGETTVEESDFEDVASGGKLIQKITNFYTDKSQYLAEIEEARPGDRTTPGFITGDFIGLTNTKQVTETYTYTSSEVVLKKVTETKELVVIILDGTDENWDDYDSIPEYFATSEQKYEEWTQIDKYTWQYETHTLKSLVRTEGGMAIQYPDSQDKTDPNATNNRIAQKTSLTWDSSEKRRSNSGQETPPAAERRPTTTRTEEYPLTYTANFQDPCSGNFKQRERTYNAEFLAGISASNDQVFIPSDSDANLQLKAIAQREGRLLRARWQGQEIAGAIPNSLLNGYQPLFGVSAVEFDGTGQSYLADGCSWVVTAQKAIFSCDGLWMGQSVGAIPVQGAIAIIGNTLSINGAIVPSAVITPDGNAVVGDVTITPDGNMIINGVTMPADGNVVIPGSVILPYTEIEDLFLGMASGIEFNSYPYLLTTTTSQIQLGLGEGIGCNGGYLASLLLGQGLGASINGDFASLYWEDFTWDSTDVGAWNSLQSLPTWESLQWESSAWNTVL
ncbi:hypothetical protein [Nostoc sp.]